MQITIYTSPKAWPDKRWLASLDLGKGLLMSFFAASEQEAIDKANSWYENEKARQLKLEPDRVIDDTEIKPTGRGSYLVGKCWMIHTHTREKVLIDQAEQALYEGRGFVKGGARSK